MNKDNSQDVQLERLKLGEILGEKLTIPDYQRIYCWEEKHVYKLLDNLVDFLAGDKEELHLGCVIIHENEKKWDIIDGQQRLVTLSLILLALNDKDESSKAKIEDISLLKQSFHSSEAKAYVAYNKHIIKNYIKNNEGKLDEDKLKNKITFSVLILNGQSLDLAYTFFSNQNSRGKSLTDFDLLKAHHLRFINDEKQAKHLATRWDSRTTTANDEDSSIDLKKIFDTYLFRLRKYLRKNTWNNNENFRVKEEFEADHIVEEIPPFGEKFDFNESIQGGSHFFGYADHFIQHYEHYVKTKPYEALKPHLGGESHWIYKDTIEGFLFAYYLKFGIQYMSEALLCIEKIVSEHRYTKASVRLKSVLEHASNSEIIMMIERSTSPTFFLAEALQKIKTFAPRKEKDLQPIQQRYNNQVKKIEEKLKPSIVVEKIKKLCEGENNDKQ